MNTQKHVQHGLALVSFSMTGLFGCSLATGVTALLFAGSMVLIQAAALLFLPEPFRQAKRKDSGLAMALYGGVMVAALLLSMTASVATLSGSYEQSASAMAERASLQKAMDGYIDAGYITKGLSVRKQLDALPDVEVSPLASAANRVEAMTGIHGPSLITGFITLLALLLDVSIILLNRPVISNSVTQASYAVTEPDNPVTHGRNSGYSVTEEPVTPALTVANVTPEIRAVIDALNDGLINKPSVREIRQLLRCSQNQAALIARNCRQLELSI